ncbi:hypothetical protein BDV06DRAFT_214953 [Aspergillus oleicola]
MKFSFAAAALFAGAAFASVHGGEDTQQQQYTTVEVTEYTTYCPKSTTLTAGSETIPVETPGTVTLSGGPYTVTRPLITTTVTHCKACSSSATPTWAPSSSVPVIPGNPTSIPVIPTEVAPTATGGASSTTPAPPTFTGGASRAAAGAGAVAGLFGVVAALL